MFLKQLIKLYFTKLLGLIISMGSMFMVIPRISHNPSLYGLYSVVLSLMLFLQYADLGFLGAGQKYAAEYYAKNDFKKECQILGFVHFVLFLVIILYLLILIYIYLNPQLVFRKISNEEELVVKKILLIFIISSPLIVLQRLVSSIFSIRLEDYYQQYIEMTFNTLKIVSVFYFFRYNHYELVNYLIIIQILSSISLILCFLLIKLRYNYPLKELMKSFRFNREVYLSTKTMAKASIFLTVCYFIYYDLDLFYIGNFYNSEVVAKFAIGLSILSFSKTLMNMFFSPFQVKFNHLKGMNDQQNLNKLFKLLIETSLPLTILPIVTIIYLMKNIVVHWVGIVYLDSVLIAQILVFQLIFNFILMPFSYLIMTLEKYKMLLFITGLLPLFYVLPFYFLHNSYGYILLPYLKSFLIILNSLYSIIIAKKIIEINLFKHLLSSLIYLIPSLLLLILSLKIYKLNWNLSMVKNNKFLFTDIISGGFIAIGSIIFYFILNLKLRKRILTLIMPHFKKVVLK